MENIEFILNKELSPAEVFLYQKIINHCYHNLNDAMRFDVIAHDWNLPFPTNFQNKQEIVSSLNKEINKFVITTPQSSIDFEYTINPETGKKYTLLSSITVNYAIRDLISHFSLLDLNLEDFEDKDIKDLLITIENTIRICDMQFCQYLKVITSEHEEVTKEMDQDLSLLSTIEQYRREMFACIYNVIKYRSKLPPELIRPQLIYFRGILLTVLLEILLLDFVSSRQASFAENSFFANLWHVLRHCYDGCALHRIEFTSAPLQRSVPIEKRSQSENTTRLKLFFEVTDKEDISKTHISELRIDLPHDNINSVHFNCSDCNKQKENCLDHFEISQKESGVQKVIYQFFEYCSIHLGQLILFQTSYREDDYKNIESFTPYLKIRQFLATHRIDELNSTTVLSEELCKDLSIPCKSNINDLAKYIFDNRF